MKKFMFVWLFAVTMVGTAHANPDGSPAGGAWLSYLFIAYYVVLVLYTGRKWVRWATALPAGEGKAKGLLDAVTWTVVCIVPLALIYVIHGYLAMLAQQL